MRGLRNLFDIRRPELPIAAGMFAWFFLAIAAYWFLKPLRSTLTVGNLGADAIRELKVIGALVSAGIVAAYSVALTRFSRGRLAALIVGAVAWCLLFFWLFFSLYGPTRVACYCFHIFLDLFISVNIALFWTCLADLFDAEAASRVYGLVGAGGVIGGVAGSLACNALIGTLPPATMILLVTAAYALILPILVLLRFTAGRHVSGIIAASGPSRLHDALAGVRDVLTSRYFLGICLVLGSYEVISAVNDFTFHKGVELTFRHDGSIPSLLGLLAAALDAATGLGARSWLASAVGLETSAPSLGTFFSQFFLTMNIAALLLQLLAASLVIRRAGMTAALLLLPLSLAVFSAGFLQAPALLLLQLLYLADNSLNYSVNQTAREMLFVPIPREQKYRTLSFIEMFVQRAAKAGGGFLLLLFPLVARLTDLASLRWLMLLTLPVALLWITIAIFLGRRYHARCREVQHHAP